ncbi:MAG: (2Fe-2S)-binding protein [Polyangiaceae bacterium]
MLVCHCHRVNDEQIRQCVRDGCGSARAVSRNCKAGSGCGGCMPLVKLVVKDELQRSSVEESGVDLLLPLAQPA